MLHEWMGSRVYQTLRRNMLGHRGDLDVRELFHEKQYEDLIILARMKLLQEPQKKYLRGVCTSTLEYDRSGFSKEQKGPQRGFGFFFIGCGITLLVCSAIFVCVNLDPNTTLACHAPYTVADCAYDIAKNTSEIGKDGLFVILFASLLILFSAFLLCVGVDNFLHIMWNSAMATKERETFLEDLLAAMRTE